MFDEALCTESGFSRRQQVLVIAKHLLFGALGRLETCVQQVKSVQTLLGVDELIVFLIL